MNRHLKYIAIVSLFLSLSACGTKNDIVNSGKGEPVTGIQSEVTKNDSGWETIEVIHYRCIIAKLEESVQGTTKWNQIVQKVKDGQDFKIGQFGKPTDELAKELAVQTVVENRVMPLFEKIYEASGPIMESYPGQGIAPLCGRSP